MGEEETAWLATLRPAPLRFPACRRCPYRTLDRPDVCLSCIGSSGAGGGETAGGTCPVCGQRLAVAASCSNDWCGRGDRWWSAAWSIGPNLGPLREALLRYKYRAEMAWSAIFGRLLVGYLDDHMPWFDDYDALVGVPAFLGPGARRAWDPVGHVLAVANDLAGRRWPVEREAIVKTAETAPMAGLRLVPRRASAEGELRHSLRVPDPSRVAGARLLVVDDVFTEGSTLREVARALRRAGAVEVGALTLARQPWSPHRVAPTARRDPGGGA
jgi:predicted amidophosphoribosyltransferase